ncbi:hypothetical protein Tco_0269831, partial [Tanacetum coccineum]
FLALGWHLEKIHVTWAHLEKKWTRLRLYTIYLEEIVLIERGDGVAGFKRRRQDFYGDGVMDLTMASGRSEFIDWVQVQVVLEGSGNVITRFKGCGGVQFEGSDLEVQGLTNPRVTHEIVKKPSHGTLDVQPGLDRETRDKPQPRLTRCGCVADAVRTSNSCLLFHTKVPLVPHASKRVMASVACCCGCVFCMKQERHVETSDELRHTDNTTLIPPRLPDILPRRTARMSVLPIEPNLTERARISAINLDDYQLDPVTPPPSPLSPFSMAAYQRMFAETDPTRREEALTAYGTETGQGSVPVPETVLTVCTTRLRGQLHTILEDMDRYLNACLEELEAFLTLWDVKPRVKECSLETLSVDELITQLRQVCEDAEDRASNAQGEARQKRKEALEEVVQRIYRNNN